MKAHLFLFHFRLGSLFMFVWPRPIFTIKKKKKSVQYVHGIVTVQLLQLEEYLLVCFLFIQCIRQYCTHNIVVEGYFSSSSSIFCMYVQYTIKGFGNKLPNAGACNFHFRVVCMTLHTSGTVLDLHWWFSVIHLSACRGAVDCWTCEGQRQSLCGGGQRHHAPCLWVSIWPWIHI